MFSIEKLVFQRGKCILMNGDDICHLFIMVTNLAQNTPTVSLQRGKTLNECPGYDT